MEDAKILISINSNAIKLTNAYIEFINDINNPSSSREILNCRFHNQLILTSRYYFEKLILCPSINASRRLIMVGEMDQF